MATITTAPVKTPVNKMPTTVIVGEYKGNPTINVCPEGNAYTGLSAGLPKWNRVMGLDKDGDSVLAEIFKVLWSKANEKEREALIASFNLAADSITKFLNPQS